MKTKYLALLVTVGALGCQQEKPCVSFPIAHISISSPASNPATGTDCFWDAATSQYVYDNSPSPDGVVGKSKVSCSYAANNWFRTRPTRDNSQRERDRDPKTGLLP